MPPTYQNLTYFSIFIFSIIILILCWVFDSNQTYTLFIIYYFENIFKSNNLDILISFHLFSSDIYQFWNFFLFESNFPDRPFNHLTTSLRNWRNGVSSKDKPSCANLSNICRLKPCTGSCTFIPDADVSIFLTFRLI